MSMDDKLNVAATLVDSQFLPNSQVQFAWDSVSITNMLACPRRYQYSIILGLHPNNPNYAIALVFGILFHKGCEWYHRARAEGKNHDEALFATCRQLADDPATATLPIDAKIKEMKDGHDPDEDDGITLRNSKIRTRYYLFRAVVWYMEQYANDPCHTLLGPSGRPAVEHSFRLPIPVRVLGVDILLCGHIDRAVEFNGSYYVKDYKTTKSLTKQYFAMFDLSHQMTGYTVAGKAIFDKPVSGAIVDGVALQVGQVKFARHFTQRTKGQIGEYMQTLQYVTEQAVLHAETGDYPMNTSSCYFCDFKDICRQPPEYRDRYIRQNYTSRPGWNPLENR